MPFRRMEVTIKFYVFLESRMPSGDLLLGSHATTQFQVTGFLQDKRNTRATCVQQQVACPNSKRAENNAQLKWQTHLKHTKYA